MNKFISNQASILFLFALCFSIKTHANEMDHNHMAMSEMDHSAMEESDMDHHMHSVSSQFPLGIMGGQVHKKGHFMLSLRQMRMSMEGNSDNNISLSDSEIINLPNPYPMMNMPSKLSVVPQKMDMNMTMIGAMYGISNQQTLMFMAMYQEKDMDLLTYSSMMNRSLLGGFKSKNQGLSNVSISTLLKIKDKDGFKLNAQIGLEKSIGENEDYGEVLTPMNMKKEIILPYSMQIGDQSTSLLMALTFTKDIEDWSYGSQLKIKNTINKKDWNHGNSFNFDGWINKGISQSMAVSFRLSYSQINSLEGRDIRVMAPVQTANPENYGGEIYSASLGFNKSLKQGNILGFELTIPFKQKLNGPQMENDRTITLGYKKSF
ncbi:MAG: hypothetical protein HOK34_06675 [Gammaproteobacteria bacterium]|nr:hypothetical protein [Gammaproteobacteria bacterium]